MLGIEVEYLLGRAVATDITRRELVEWPPHPTRLFSALVDALADMAGEPCHADGETALRWLEELPAPTIRASIAENVDCPRAAKYFVPINDEIANPANVRATPLVELRTRQERFFPRAIPAEPRVAYSWSAAEPPPAVQRGLVDLTSRVAYLGHSSSLVRVCCTVEPIEPTLVPSDEGEFVLRVPGPGRLDRLNAVHQARKNNTLAQPPLGKTVRYGIAGAEYRRGPYRDTRVIAFDRVPFGLTETALVISRLRQALLSKLPDGAACPESLSGHGVEGGPAASRTHIAFVPLANVSNASGEHSDGALKGVGILLPRDLADGERAMLDAALANLRELVFGARGRFAVHVFSASSAHGAHARLRALNPARYGGASRTWSTVTPVALGRHPKPKKGLTEEEILAGHIREIGLPVAENVAIHRVSAVWGSSRAEDHRRDGVKALAGRVLRHASIRFSEPVKGPLVVGAGRHMGFGLLIPREE